MLSHQISIQHFLLMVLFVVQMLFKLFQEQWCVTSLLCLQLLKPKRRPLFYGWLHVTGAEKEKKRRSFSPSSCAIFTLQLSSCMIREMLSNKETMARLCPLSCSTSNGPFDASHLEQHIRGRSVLGDLLQTGIHEIAEIVRPGDNERCYHEARNCHTVQFSCIRQ